MTNKDLFKQAIAEAKSIREAAIANAKTALEETLTPHLKNMLAAKLQEMEEEEDVDYTMGSQDKNQLPNPPKSITIEEEDLENLEGEEGSEDSEQSEEELEDEPIDFESMTMGDLKNLIKDLITQEEAPEEEEEEMGDELPADDMIGAEDEEEIDLDELLSELSEMGKDPIEEDRPGYGVGDLTDDNDLIRLASLIAKKGKAAHAKALKFMQDLAADNASVRRMEESKTSKELAEALKTIRTLTEESKKTNLLNAKLLYVNRIFKANQLSESQKVNIITAFDKAETVKEVKLVFETVSKSGVTNKPAQSTGKRLVKEGLLGGASKATGVTAKRPEIIAESAAVLRMQKLAGIIK